MNPFDEYTFRLTRRPYHMWDGIEIRMICPQQSKFVENITFHERVEKDCGVSVPAIASLRMDQAQHIMDQLWECSIRPTQGHGTMGQLGAVQYHLEDMRKLVFKEK